MNETKSSTGGRIIQTKTGLIHYGDTEKFADAYENKTGINGRPTKESVESGLKFDFTSFGSITIPQWTGPSRIVSF